MLGYVFIKLYLFLHSQSHMHNRTGLFFRMWFSVYVWFQRAEGAPDTKHISDVKKPKCI